MILKNKLEAVRAGERIALAQVISQVENQTTAGQEALSALFPFSGQAHLIGITGSPGTGKSTLTAQLARAFRKPPDGDAPQRVGILAIDPTSPFSGGAVLGDRIRMRDLAGDDGVFIRSMASRGALGGLSAATAAAATVLDAAGYTVILIETVGAGQDDVEIVRLAHTTLVVEAPDMGDEVQAIKAGILEIADILVLNKADLAGVARAERALRNALELADSSRPFTSDPGHHHEGVSAPGEPQLDWRPPLIKTMAKSGQGTEELYHAIKAHKQYLIDRKLWDKKNSDRLKNELELYIRENLFKNWKSEVDSNHYRGVLKNVLSRQLSPQKASQDLVKQPKSSK
jgi:LAO/AO transport system kinase